MDVKILYEAYLRSGKISTDSRQITPGSVFFALKGPKFNANEFASQALEKGAGYAVVDERKFAADERYVLVDDTLVALQQLARHHRSQIRIPVIGLTGSNGKTTTKELIHAALSKKFKVLATRGNLNNHIGVPLTILSIDASIGIAVVEMGANHVGEIASLCDIARPTHGLITNIGMGHVGTFGGFENVIRGKSELYQFLMTNDGVVFINSQNHILANMAKRFKSPLFYPAKGDYYHCELIGADPFVAVRTETNDTIQTQLVGSYNFENVAAALCVAKFFDVDSRQAQQAIAAYVPGNMRSQVVQRGDNTIILDAYNANPSSMQAAIENLAGMKAVHKVAILGDMFELGDESEREHRKLGTLLAANGINDVYLCGKLIGAAAEVLPRAIHATTKDELIKQLASRPIRGATILIKASRGMGLETIVDVL